MMKSQKQTALFLFPILVLLAGMMLLNRVWLNEYRSASYQEISAFCQTVLEQDPESEELLLSALKEYTLADRTRTSGGGVDSPKAADGSDSPETSSGSVSPETPGGSFLNAYGYTRGAFSIRPAGAVSLLIAAVAAVVTAVFLLSAWLAAARRRARIDELTLYLEQVNTGEAGTLLQTREDEFSHLQDEIYKTVTNLYVTREQAVNAKENFADNLANIAHQLKTPLTAALLSLQLMERSDPNEFIRPIRNQLARLTRLEEALLTLSKIDSGTLILDHSPVDLYTVLSLASENLGELTAREQLRVEIPDKGSIEILGDMEWTMEALMNLMKNCMEHSPAGGTIHCDYSQNPLYTEILIWDEGAGFDPGDLPHLFERFYRGKQAEGTGAGIGLALACSLFELQNGCITARNLPSGGACFEIRIYSH